MVFLLDLQAAQMSGTFGACHFRFRAHGTILCHIITSGQSSHMQKTLKPRVWLERLTAANGDST